MDATTIRLLWFALPLLGWVVLPATLLALRLHRAD